MCRCARKRETWQSCKQFLAKKPRNLETGRHNHISAVSSLMQTEFMAMLSIVLAIAGHTEKSR